MKLSERELQTRSWVLLTLTGLVALGLSIAVSFLFPWPSIPYWAVDFTVFYAAAAAIVHGNNPYVLASLTQHVPSNTINIVLSYSYPPLLALLLAPSTALPLNTAARMWLTINLLAPGVSIGAILKATGWKPKPLQLAALVLACMLFLPCLYTYVSGQASLWSLLWASLGVFFISRGRHISTGTSLALAWAKPHPLPFVPIHLLFGDRRALIVFITILLASLGLVSGWILSWPDAAIHAFGANASQQEILYQATALGALSFLGPVGAVLRAVVGGMALALTIVLARRTTEWRTLTVAQLSLGLFIAPYIGRSDVAIALIPIMLILSDRQLSTRPSAALAILAWGSSFVCVLLRVLLNIDWLLLPLVWGTLTQWFLAAASLWYVRARLQHFDNKPSSL